MDVSYVLTDRGGGDGMTVDGCEARDHCLRQHFIGVKTLDILNETLGHWQQYQTVLQRLGDNFQPSLC